MSTSSKASSGLVLALHPWRVWIIPENSSSRTAEQTLTAQRDTNGEVMTCPERVQAWLPSGGRGRVRRGFWTAWEFPDSQTFWEVWEVPGSGRSLQHPRAPQEERMDYKVYSIGRTMRRDPGWAEDDWMWGGLRWTELMRPTEANRETFNSRLQPFTVQRYIWQESQFKNIKKDNQ